MSNMKLFVLDRKEDETGISGTGIIAEGVQFSNGKCALNWRSEYTSTAIYDDIETLMKIHGHDGKTVLMWEALASDPRLPFFLSAEEDVSE